MLDGTRWSCDPQQCRGRSWYHPVASQPGSCQSNRVGNLVSEPTLCRSFPKVHVLLLGWPCKWEPKKCADECNCGWEPDAVQMGACRNHMGVWQKFYFSSITIIFMCMNGLCWDFQFSNEYYNTPLKNAWCERCAQNVKKPASQNFELIIS